MPNTHKNTFQHTYNFFLNSEKVGSVQYPDAIVCRCEFTRNNFIYTDVVSSTWSINSFIRSSAYFVWFQFSYREIKSIIGFIRSQWFYRLWLLAWWSLQNMVPTRSRQPGCPLLSLTDRDGLNCCASIAFASFRE